MMIKRQTTVISHLVMTNSLTTTILSIITNPFFIVENQSLYRIQPSYLLPTQLPREIPIDMKGREKAVLMLSARYNLLISDSFYQRGSVEEGRMEVYIAGGKHLLGNL